MEKLALRGHEVCVIDYEITWRAQRKGGLYSRRQVFERVSKIHRGVSVTVVRPAILKIPHLDYLSIIFSHTREIARQIKEFKPDIVIGFGILNTFVAMRLARRCDTPFVYYLIDALHTLVPFGPYQPIARAFERMTLRGAEKVLAINEELRRYAVEMGAEPGETIALRAGIDLERFNPKKGGDEIRRLFGIQRRDIVLLFMGWLYKFSGLREVALELTKAKNKYPNLKLLVVGDGDLLPDLKSIKSKYGLEQLILAGRQPYDRIPDFISASDVCLLPALDNAIMQSIVPIKMYEYMACGKPVIATRLPGIMREFGYDNGVIYVDKPAQALQQAVELSDDNGAMKKWGARARNFVESHSWDKITDEFEDILQATVSRARPSDMKNRAEQRATRGLSKG
jgi:glycosyltransferase involved in cell wall biosynthesis